jgi:hypothetical protein
MTHKILRLVDGKNYISFLSPISMVSSHIINHEIYHCTDDDTCPVCSILPIKFILNRELKELRKMSKFMAWAIVDGEEGIIQLSCRQYIDPFIQIKAFNDDIILNNDFIIKTTESDEIYGVLFTKFKSIDKIKAKNPRTKLMDKITAMGKQIPEDVVKRLTIDVAKINLLSMN